MATWYRTGTVSVSNGSTTVTGNLTAWLMAAKVGDAFDGPDGKRYEITAVTSNTAIEILPAYAGSTASGQSYAIERISTAWNSVSELSVTIAETAEAFQRGFAMKSTSSVAIGSGTKEFVAPSGLPILPGAQLKASSATPGEEASHWISGTVTEYTGQTLKLQCEQWGGSGTRTSWNINISGQRGPAGPEGPQGPQGIQGNPGPQGVKGDAGNKGWSPVFAVVTDGARRVLQVDDWVGGEGPKPATGSYVGATGLVGTIGEAVDIRGPAGAGDGDVNGPISSTDNAIPRFDGITGKTLKSSTATLDDTGILSAAQFSVPGFDAGGVVFNNDSGIQRRSGSLLALWTIGNISLRTGSPTGDSFLDVNNSGLSIGTTRPLTTGTIELGHAADTTISRVAAGVAAIEGNQIVTANRLATDAIYGIVSFATAPEVAAGSADDLAVTPAGAAAVYSPITRRVNAQTGTTYTFVLADAGKLVTFNNGAAVTATVPPNASVAFPVNTQIDLAALGAGQVTVAAGSGVTIRSEGGRLRLAKQYSGGTLVKIATNEWLLVGSLAA